jgi:hypothetical protein
MIEKFQTLEVRGRKSSKPWKFFAVLFPMLGSLAMAQGPGSLSQAGFFQAWWGGFNPSKLPNLIFWIDASRANTVTIDGGRVASITDLSTNAYTVQQLITTNRPTYAQAALNGRNVIRFTAASNHFFNTSTIGVPNSFTELKVFSRPATGVNNMGLANNLSGNNRIYQTFWYFLDNGTYEKSSSGSAFTTLQTGNASTGLFYTATIRNSTNSVQYRRNGAVINTITSGAGVTTAPSGNYNVFASGNDGTTQQYNQGDIAEYILYNRALTTNEILEVEAYLTTKWGL